jgi:hypothetical protein
MNRYAFNHGYLCEIDLIPELYVNAALKREIIAELTASFGDDTRVLIGQASPGLPNRVGGRSDQQARKIVLSIMRRYKEHYPTLCRSIEANL